MRRTVVSSLAVPSCALSLAFALAADVAAQCSNVWLPGAPVPGVSGPARATAMWDPDGPGPLASCLIVGGEFLIAGREVVNRIAAYDLVTETWTGLGTGLDAPVNALAVLPNGELIAAGEFQVAGGGPCSYIARWNGTAWSPLGAGMNWIVRALAVMANGDLVAGGQFTAAGGITCQRVARWNGASWSPMAGGFDGTVDTLHAWNGGVVAGGSALVAATPALQRVAFWSGAAWQPLGAGLNGVVRSFATMPNGDLVASGVAVMSIPVSPFQANTVRWNGTAWTPLGTQGGFYDMVALASGELVGVGGTVLSWNGATWTSLGATFVAPLYAIEVLPNGDLVVAGADNLINSVPLAYVARRSAGVWRSLPAALATIHTATTCALTGNGDLVVGGTLHAPGGHGVARWDGTSWTGLGLGPSGVYSVAMLPGGDVVASGYLSTGGPASWCIARWNGASWSQLGAGSPVGADVRAAALPNGEVIAYAFDLARWDGATWHLYPPGYPQPISRLVVRPNGNIVVAGYQTGPAVTVTEWNGQTWSAFGSGLTGNSPFAIVYALALLPNGDVVAGGTFATAGGVPALNVARWDGSAWHAIGAGLVDQVDALVALPDGRLVAATTATPVTAGAIRRLVRWDGTAWSPVNVGGVAAELAGAALGGVAGMAASADGTLFVVGDFDVAGGLGAHAVAALSNTCAPAAAPYGGGCSGSAGPVVLAVEDGAWLASTFRARATGLTTPSLAVGVFGFSQIAIPLPIAHPLGVPGCTLLVADDILIQFLAGAGSVTTRIDIPNQAVLLGATFQHQVVPVEIDGSGHLTALTSTNGLTLTIGTF